jgi:hypothetical protein
MDSATIMIYGSGGVASASAMVALAAGGFTKPAAAVFAVAGGVVPWLFIAMWSNQIPSSTLGSAVSLFGSGPLFLLAFFLYGIGAPARGRGIAAAASLVGMFAGFGFSLFLSGRLARME